MENDTASPTQNAENAPKQQIATKEPTPRPVYAPGSVEDLQQVVLAAAEHEAFEECFGLPGFARVKRLAEIATDYVGAEVAGPDLLAGGRLDTRSPEAPDGFSAKLFEAIFVRHQLPWNGGARR